MIANAEPDARDAARLARLHAVAGWSALFLFLTLGGGLEILHGYKVGWYLDAGNATRRLMWTLAHAHGTLLGTLNVLFGLSIRALPWRAAGRRLASTALLGATVLLPGGFLLGGWITYAGDPGLGILLVPAGALALLISVGLTALTALRMPRA